MRPGVVAILLFTVLTVSLALQPLTEKSILEEAYSQVFIIACDNSSYGTGWWINKQYAVTAYHVVDSCKSITGIRGAWSSRLELVAYDPQLDVAVLRAENPPDWAQGLPLSFKVSIGDEVYVVGYPLQVVLESGRDLARASVAPRVAKATIAWISPGEPKLEFEGSTDKGNSGGPIVSSETGGVVAIVNYAREGAVSASFYGTRMDALARFLDENNIEYDVAGGPSPVLLGLGVLALGALALIMVNRRGEAR